MSPLRRLRRAEGQDGFSLVEILVSISIFGVVAAAILPLLVAGMRGGTVAKLGTQAKGVAQERLEQMRTLPYYIAQQNGDYLDVLDVYFRDTVTTTAAGAATDPCQTRRYILASKSYECVARTTVVGATTFNQTIVTRFVNASGAVVTPLSTYRSWQSGADAPASGLLEVVITTTWKVGNDSKSFVLRSSIASSASGTPLITSQIRASAVKVTGATELGDALQFEAGLLSADGSKATASSANASAVGAYASRSSGASAQGAEMTLNAPADDVQTLPATVDPQMLDSCLLICFGDTKIKGEPRAIVSTGVPQIGVNGATKALASQLSDSGEAARRGFSFSNTDPATAAVQLGVSNLALVTAVDSGAGALATSEGYLDAKGTGATSVTASVKAAANTVRLFRSATAPEGLVQVKLTNASLTCVDGAGAGVTADWAAEVRVHTSALGYTTYTVAPNASALPAPSTITTSSGFPLSRYVQAWSGLVGSAASAQQASTSGVMANIPAVVTILTTQTRPDVDSAINIAVGAVSCKAEDNQ